MISVVIPCYNCEPFIADHLERLVGFLEKQFPQFEVIAVDDGSTDGTLAQLKRQSARDARIRTHALPHNKGKGAAVKLGMLEARGEAVIFTDADLPYDLSAVPKFVRTLEGGADVVLGARFEGEQGDKKIDQQHAHRTTLSHLFAALANVTLRERVPDTQAGIKGFTKDAAQTIFQKVNIPRFCFDVEAIAIAQQQGMKIVSVPVTLVHQSESTVRVGRDGMQMCFDLAWIFWKYRIRT